MLLALVITLIAGCEKSINIQPALTENLLVVDGNIENGQPPVIFLSTSINYFSTINPQVLAGTVVNNAVVTLTDGIKTHRLKAYIIPIGGGYSLAYYSNDPASPSTAIIGERGKTYSLKIEWNNATYNSVTTIPASNKTIDSLWWVKAPSQTDTARVTVMGRITDPVGYGDYIRYFTKVNDSMFLPGLNSVYDDQITDGTTYELPINKGINRNNPPDFENYGFFRRGDSVTIKFCNIDRATFNFWRTLEFSYSSVGNPFSSPTKVLGNVSNGALGAFCGYFVRYKTIIIPK